MTEENKMVFGDINDLVVDGTDSDCYLIVNDGGLEWQNSSISISDIPAGNVEINTAEGGKFLVDGVDVMDRIAKLEAMVEDLTAMKDAPQKWDPAMHAATQEEVLEEIAKQAQERAEYDFEMMEHMNRKDEQAEEDATKAYDRAMGIIE